jgi:hypothetical protein
MRRTSPHRCTRLAPHLAEHLPGTARIVCNDVAGRVRLQRHRCQGGPQTVVEVPVQTAPFEVPCCQKLLPRLLELVILSKTTPTLA